MFEKFTEMLYHYALLDDVFVHTSIIRFCKKKKYFCNTIIFY